jgi:uncharacterized LabA/DUF88 family protein
VRTIAYIDGFNLFYGSLKGRAWKWLDLCAYFERTLPPECKLVKVKYFTARVSGIPGNPDGPKRQDVYLRALREHLGARFEVVEGHFKFSSSRAPLAEDPTQRVKVLKTEEKGSDVNLAVELLNDAWLDVFDCAAVVSNDADLARAMQLVKQQRAKRVVLYTPGAPKRRPLNELKQWSHHQVGVLENDLAVCQLPNPTPGGLTKPVGW